MDNSTLTHPRGGGEPLFEIAAMIVNCAKCEKPNNVAEPVKPAGRYRCAKCGTTLPVHSVKIELDPGEIAFPALCGKNGSQFAFVVRERLRGVLEVVRAIPISPISKRTGDPPVTPPTPTAAVSGKSVAYLGRQIKALLGRSELQKKSEASLGEKSQPDTSHSPSVQQPRNDVAPSAYTHERANVTAPIRVHSTYQGCPYCGDRGVAWCAYGHHSCCNTRTKQHDDHTDRWCLECEDWVCCTGPIDAPASITGVARRAKPLPEKAHMDRTSAAGTNPSRSTTSDPTRQIADGKPKRK
jgi:hypothetical protein